MTAPVDWNTDVNSPPAPLPGGTAPVSCAPEWPGTVAALCRAIGGSLTLGDGVPSDGETIQLGPVVIDSRRVQAGDVFWGLPGSRHHGGAFAVEAFRRGAAGVVVDRAVEVPRGCWAIRLTDTQRALERAAQAKRAAFGGTVIAVTGSVGKTTARQMIHTVLGHRWRGTASPRSYNNHVGLPLSMLRMEPSHDYALFELGASGPGEIGRLAALCRPQIGVITGTAEAHLAGFGDRQGVAETKAELLDALPPHGHAVVGDDPLLRRLARRCAAPMLWVGRSVDCHLRASHVEMGNGWLSFRIDGQAFRLPVWGRHHLGAALLAIGVARVWGMRLAEASEALEGFEPVPMRCEVLDPGGVTVINDAYNANPTSMKAALQLLREVRAPGRRVVVCGDMAELGPGAAQWHFRLGGEVVTVSGADLLVACGEYAGHVVRGAQTAGMAADRTMAVTTPEQALPVLTKSLRAGDVVLIKASRRLKMETLVEALCRQLQPTEDRTV